MKLLYLILIYNCVPDMFLFLFQTNEKHYITAYEMADSGEKNTIKKPITPKWWNVRCLVHLEILQKQYFLQMEI